MSYHLHRYKKGGWKNPAAREHVGRLRQHMPSNTCISLLSLGPLWCVGDIFWGKKKQKKYKTNLPPCKWIVGPRSQSEPGEVRRWRDWEAAVYEKCNFPKKKRRLKDARRSLVMLSECFSISGQMAGALAAWSGVKLRESVGRKAVWLARAESVPEIWKEFF